MAIHLFKRLEIQINYLDCNRSMLLFHCESFPNVKYGISRRRMYDIYPDWAMHYLAPIESR